MLKNLPANAGDTGDMDSIPGLGRSSRGGNGNPLQYSSLGNPMDGRAWQATVHGVSKSQTQLSEHANVQMVNTVSFLSSLYIPPFRLQILMCMKPLGNELQCRFLKSTSKEADFEGLNWSSGICMVTTGKFNV